PGMRVFRGSMAGLCSPLPTLRHLRRTARGRCGSLLLHRSGLSPPTPCRFNRRTLLLPQQRTNLAASPKTTAMCQLNKCDLDRRRRPTPIWRAGMNDDTVVADLAVALCNAAQTQKLHRSRDARNAPASRSEDLGIERYQRVVIALSQQKGVARSA